MADTILKLVGSKIREIRKSQGLSQEQLGEKAGFHFSYIGGLERGERNVTLSNLAQIADTLRIEISDLFGYVVQYRKDINERETSLEEAFTLLLNRDEKEIRMAINILSEVFNTYAPK